MPTYLTKKCASISENRYPDIFKKIYVCTIESAVKWLPTKIEKRNLFRELEYIKYLNPFYFKYNIFTKIYLFPGK